MPRDLERLFVYGTLLPGLRPPHLSRILDGTRRLGSACLRAIIVDFGSYPGVIVHPLAIAESLSVSDRRHYGSVWSQVARSFFKESGRIATDSHNTDDNMDSYNAAELPCVHGELFKLSDLKIRQDLDDYEDYHPLEGKGLFKRVVVKVCLDETGETVRSWIYVYPRIPPPSARFVSSGDYRAYRAGLRRGPSVQE